MVDALTMYHLYAQLVMIHGWTPDEYQSWLCGLLLATARPGDPRRT